MIGGFATRLTARSADVAIVTVVPVDVLVLESVNVTVGAAIA